MARGRAEGSGTAKPASALRGLDRLIDIDPSAKDVTVVGVTLRTGSALFRYNLPTEIAGCTPDTATSRVDNGSSTEGRSLSGPDLGDLGRADVDVEHPAGDHGPARFRGRRHGRREDPGTPQTTIDLGSDHVTAEANATFAFSADEPGVTFRCARNRAGLDT